MAALAAALGLLAAPLMGASPLQATQPPDTLRFDPVTDAPLAPAPAPAFDPLTGLPLAPGPAPAFDPLTGLPVEAKSEATAPTPSRFDPVTGEALDKTLPIEPSPPVRVPVAGLQVPASSPLAPKLRPRGARHMPIQATGGLVVASGKGGVGAEFSYRFDQTVTLEKFKRLPPFKPAITLGGLSWYAFSESDGASGFSDEEYSIAYGLITGHFPWTAEPLKGSLFLGAGLGRYDYYSSHDFGFSGQESPFQSGLGLVLAAGAQLQGRRFMGDVRLLRTPLPGSFIGQLTPMASIGVQARGLW